MKKAIFDENANKWLRIQGYVKSLIESGITDEEKVFRKALSFANNIFQKRFDFYIQNGMMGKIRQLQEDIITHIKSCIRIEKEMAVKKMKEEGIYKTIEEVSLEEARKYL
ncbi:MAG: hypothetical protein H5T45_01415 [Thermoplasmatales archaeon]|nr:hypothetical protein [Thermoplasmatales archaeon]